MQYMLMIYDNLRAWEQLPAAQRGAMMEEYGTFTQDIVKSGHFRAGAQLQPSPTATTLRDQKGTIVTTDGPFAETREQLGGYYLVECKDLDEALALARRIPSLRLGGSVEVRALVPTSQAAKLPAA